MIDKGKPTLSVHLTINKFTNISVSIGVGICAKKYANVWFGLMNKEANQALSPHFQEAQQGSGGVSQSAF